MVDVFISYSRADQPIAEKLNELLATEGWDVWFDTEIYAGALWEDVLMETLDKAKAVIVLWTRNSVGSKWVAKEARLAAGAGKLVPAMLEPCELPRAFASVEAAQLLGWTGGAHSELAVLYAGLSRLAPPSRIDTVRPGFDTAFLGQDVGLPAITGVGEEFRYLHFSVVMNPARRLAWYVAYNMTTLDGDAPPRGDGWMADPMLPRAFQPLNEHYRGTGYDRGHLARPAAVTWGEYRLAAIANRQSFFFTNTAPQRPDVNQHWWRALEEWEGQVTNERGRAVAFSGPILQSDDPLHGDASAEIGRLVAHQTFRLPRSFWKVVVAPDARDRLALAAFRLDDREVEPSARDPVDPDRFRVTLASVEADTGIEFSDVLHRAATRPLRLAR